MTYCISIPTEATAGLSFKASAMLFAYQAPAWTVTLHLRGPGQIDLEATSDGMDHKFSADAAATTEWLPGNYWWSIIATDGQETLEVERGTFTVRPSLVNATGPYDGRTDNEKALDAIEAVLGKRATLDQERYRINNRELYRTPIADLIKLRTFYAAAVRREKAKAKGSSAWGCAVQVKFA